jgi:UDPglucose--hexose-1-phosphate uridylyltransferase
MYFDETEGSVREYIDRRPLTPSRPVSEARYDAVTEEWIVVAGHRQGRTFRPPPDECPLCPSRDGRLSEIPAPDYDVVVFENRFPTLATLPPGAPERAVQVDSGLMRRRPGDGRCEVVCFSSDHEASLATLPLERIETIIEVWIDRTAELSTLPEVEQVYCFENRGTEIGVTLSHPHGQIYAWPFVTSRTSRMLAAATRYRAESGGNLFEDLLAAERADGSRVVAAGEYWTAFVPFAAHWPYEVHLYPNRRVPDLMALTRAERAEFAAHYQDVLRRFDLLFPNPTPYISALHQAPVRAAGRDELALHLELFTVRRAPDKLKYLAGTESGMGTFSNDIPPEIAAERLRDVA